MNTNFHQIDKGSVIEFLIIDRSLAQLNKSNPEVLLHNAREQCFFRTNAFLSPTCYDIVSRIVRKIVQPTENETVLKKRLCVNKNLLQPAQHMIEAIEAELLQIEEMITADMSVDTVLDMVQNHISNFSLN